MARERKQTREQKYRELLAEFGKRLEDCKVLAFRFENEFGPEMLHYELMYPLRPVYHLFDSFGNTAIVIVPVDSENEKMCKQLADLCGGVPTTPDLR